MSLIEENFIFFMGKSDIFFLYRFPIFCVLLKKTIFPSMSAAICFSLKLFDHLELL